MSNLNLNESEQVLIVSTSVYIFVIVDVLEFETRAIFRFQMSTANPAPKGYPVGYASLRRTNIMARPDHTHFVVDHLTDFNNDRTAGTSTRGDLDTI